MARLTESMITNLRRSGLTGVVEGGWGDKGMPPERDDEPMSEPEPENEHARNAAHHHAQAKAGAAVTAGEIQHLGASLLNATPGPSHAYAMKQFIHGTVFHSKGDHKNAHQAFAASHEALGIDYDAMADRARKGH